MPDLENLAQITSSIRQNIIQMLLNAGSGHSAGAMGLADVFTALYFAILNHDPKNPWWEERDRLILSNGHVCPVWYATLAEAGYFSKDELNSLRKLSSRLQGHPKYQAAPGIENTSGSLGQGLSIACGIALGARLQQKKFRTYCIMGDGEQQEGQVWEAYLFAGKNKLSNLTAIIDRNNIQIDGHTEDVMPLEPLKAKLEAFNWHVLEVDGHNIKAIVDSCREAQAIFEKPTAIIAHTIPGKGVDFMENDFRWHGKAPDQSQAIKALMELRSLKGQIDYD